MPAGRTDSGGKQSVHLFGSRFAVLLIAASLAVPAGLWGLAAWLQYRQVFAELWREADRNVDMLREHAAKVFETHELVLQLAERATAGMDWPAIVRSASVQAELADLAERLPQIDSVWVTDPTSTYWSGSAVMPPMPAVDIRDRDFMQVYLAGQTGLYVSDPFVGRVTGRPTFNTSRAREGPGGGLLVASVRPSYFLDFYAEALPAADRVIGLVKASGMVLVRHPPLASAAPVQLGPGSGLMQAIMTAPERGAFRTVAQVDGVDRIYAYRRVGDLPLYVSIGLAAGEGWARWRGPVLAYGLAALLASALLLALSFYGLRAAARARLAQERLAHVERLEALGRLAGGIAHDFRNVLQTIASVFNLVERRTEDRDVTRMVEAGRKALERTSRRVQQLLTFGRKDAAAPELTDLNLLIRDVVKLMRPNLGGIEVRLELAGALPPVLVDPAEAEHALINLLANARDAMPVGGSLRVATAAVPEGVTLTVADSGTGVPPEVLPHLFEPFFTTKERGRGTGLGLSQVHGFARQAGGRVEVTSEPGQGASFRILLPAQPATEA